MAKKSRKQTQAQKQLRANLSVLKKAGLYKGDPRKATGSGNQKRLVREYKELIPQIAAGKLRTVKVGTVRKAKAFPEALHPRHGKVLVPVKKGETPRYNPKTKQITSTRREYGITYRRIILLQKVFKLEDLPTPPKGKRYLYVVPFNGWTTSPRFEDRKELAAFMAGYQERFKNWLEYVEVHEVSKKAFEADADDEGGL